MSDTGIGLRELKKQMTRESIAEAALRLAHEKGLEHVTIEEIAAQAIVSPRTFSNYFSCKEEAIVAAGTGNLGEILDRRTDDDPERPLLEVLRDATQAYVRARTPEQIELAGMKAELAQKYPALQPWRAAQYDEIEDVVRVYVARRTRTHRDRDLYPGLVAGVATAAIRAAVRNAAARRQPAHRLHETIGEAFDQMIAGLPVPQRPVRRSRAKTPDTPSP